VSNNSDSLNIVERYSRGLEFLRQKDVDGARREFDGILEVDSEYALAYFGIGCVLALQGFIDRAVEEWERAVEIDPDCGEAHYVLAWAYYRIDQTEKGYQHVSKAHESNVDLNQVKEIVDLFNKEKRDLSFNLDNEVRKTYSRELLVEKVTRYKKDVLYFAIIIFFGLFLGFRFFTYEYLSTGYPDWIYQAYRIKSMQNYGFLSWSNDWVGGFPIWQAYQFIPHLISAIISNLSGWSVTKTMMVLTGCLFLLLRLFVYFTIRKSGFSAEASLFSSLLSYTILGYFRPVSDFSFLWGVSFFPLVFYLAWSIKEDNSRMILYGILLGGSFYIHPILAIIAGLTLLVRVLTDYNIPNTKLFIPIVLSGLASSFYWLPLIFGDKPTYTDPWVYSTAWQRVNMPKTLLGLSFSLLVSLSIVIIFVFKVKRDQWSTFILVLLLTLATTVFLSYWGFVPSFINLAMPTRWMVFIGFLIALFVAPVIDWGKTHRYFIVVFPILLLLIAFEGYTITQQAIPNGSDNLISNEAMWVVSHPSEISYSDKVFSENIPWLSYFAFGNVRTTGHYFIQGAYDLLTSPLKWLMLSEENVAPVMTGNFTIAKEFLKITGTTHVILQDSVPMARALLPGGIFENELNLVDHKQGISVFRVPWEPAQAFYTRIDLRESLQFPDIGYTTYDEVRERDRLVLEFNRIMDLDSSSIVPAYFPSQTEVELEIENIEAGQYLIIFIQYDGSWIATVNGERVLIERNGPNYVGLDISDFTGDLSIHLVHGIHWTWKAGGAITIISFLIGVYVYVSKLRGRELKIPI